MSGKSQEGFFKIRPTKRSNPEERTTLDVIHQFQLKRIEEEKEEAVFLEEEANTLKTQIEETNDDLLRGQLENQFVRLQEELGEKKKEDRIYDYLLETGDLLFDYYDIQEKISQGSIGAITQRSKRKPGDVLSALETAAAIDTPEQPELVPVVTTKQAGKKKKEDKPLSRDILLEKYL